MKNPEASAPYSNESESDRLQKRADSYNKEVGSLPGYDCPKCLNKSHIAIVRDGYEVMAQCSCMGIRESMRRIEKSGLSKSLSECTFEKYTASDAWQINIKATVERFAENPAGAWLYIGGQVGAGKTHLCTAAVGKLLHAGMSAHYMLWRDESVRLKAIVNNDEEYAADITPLKTVDVLYIDDFLKTERGKLPTAADINLAFEILNHRYINRELVTILSSELSVEQLLDVDEAVGSRIFQRTRGYSLHISHSRDKNYRLHAT